jgi:hypothetical protein
MTAVQTKLMWLEAISQRLRWHIECDGDCGSKESALLSVLLFRAISDVSTVSDPQPGGPRLTRAEGSPQSSLP